MAKSPSIRLAVQAPNTEEGRQQLIRAAADAYCDAILRAVGALRCAPAQKKQLLDAVISQLKSE